MTDLTTTLPNIQVSSGFFAKWREPAIRGALFKVFSCLSFSGVNGIVRYFSIVSNETGTTPIPAQELAFFETLFGLFFILPWVLSSGKSAFKATNQGIYIARALAASCGLILWFTALSKMPIVQVVAFKYSGPLFTILGAKIFLGENCGWARAVAIGTAIFGALVITGHNFFDAELHWSELTLLALLPMGASACYVASAVLAKKQVKYDKPQTVCIYLFLYTLPVLGFASSFQWIEPLAWQWPWLIVMGALLAAAYFFLQYAYVVADITYLVPMSFTRLIAGAVIGMIFFSEWPTIWTWLGSFLILLATVNLCKYEVKRKKAKQAPPPASAPVPEAVPEPATALA